MSDRELPARPRLEQYRTQAKELVIAFREGDPEALRRFQRHHPEVHGVGTERSHGVTIALADAQLVLAREHGFPSWPKLQRYVRTQEALLRAEELGDPLAVFLEVSTAPRHADHASGGLEQAEALRARYPDVATSSIHAAAVLGDEAGVRRWLREDPASVLRKAGALEADPLTTLCFSRYLRIERGRSAEFVAAARVLLEAGAPADTGWTEMIDYPTPRAITESAIYGAAGVAGDAELTRLLLEHGADPNDEETAYHAAEGYDLSVLRVLLESGRMDATSLRTLLVRKADWHDREGMALVLKFGADPNLGTRWGTNALQHAIQRDNGLEMIALLLDHGADPALCRERDGLSAAAIAARRGRGDVLEELERRGMLPTLQGLDGLLAACARDEEAAVEAMVAADPELRADLLARGGTVLAEFAGTGNVRGMRRLLALGVPANATYREGDGYFEIPPESAVLCVAAWHAWPGTVEELLEHGAPVDVRDANGRSALMLAVRACVGSHWTRRRSTDGIAALLRAGASAEGVQLPTGYEEADALFRSYGMR